LAVGTDDRTGFVDGPADGAKLLVAIKCGSMVPGRGVNLGEL